MTCVFIDNLFIGQEMLTINAFAAGTGRTELLSQHGKWENRVCGCRFRLKVAIGVLISVSIKNLVIPVLPGLTDISG